MSLYFAVALRTFVISGEFSCHASGSAAWLCSMAAAPSASSARMAGEAKSVRAGTSEARILLFLTSSLGPLSRRQVDRHLGDAVDRQVVEGGSLANGVFARPFVDAERLGPLRVRVRLDPVDADRRVVGVDLRLG